MNSGFGGFFSYRTSTGSLGLWEEEKLPLLFSRGEEGGEKLESKLGKEKSSKSTCTSQSRRPIFEKYEGCGRRYVGVVRQLDADEHLKLRNRRKAGV